MFFPSAVMRVFFPTVMLGMVPGSGFIALPKIFSPGSPGVGGVISAITSPFFIGTIRSSSRKSAMPNSSYFGLGTRCFSNRKLMRPFSPRLGGIARAMHIGVSYTLPSTMSLMSRSSMPVVIPFFASSAITPCGVIGLPPLNGLCSIMLAVFPSGSKVISTEPSTASFFSLVCLGLSSGLGAGSEPGAFMRISMSLRRYSSRALLILCSKSESNAIMSP